MDKKRVQQIWKRLSITYEIFLLRFYLSNLRPRGHGCIEKNKTKIY